MFLYNEEGEYGGKGRKGEYKFVKSKKKGEARIHTDPMTQLLYGPFPGGRMRTLRILRNYEKIINYEKLFFILFFEIVRNSAFLSSDCPFSCGKVFWKGILLELWNGNQLERKVCVKSGNCR